MTDRPGKFRFSRAPRSKDDLDEFMTRLFGGQRWGEYKARKARLKGIKATETEESIDEPSCE